MSVIGRFCIRKLVAGRVNPFSCRPACILTNALPWLSLWFPSQAFDGATFELSQAKVSDEGIDFPELILESNAGHPGIMALTIHANIRVTYLHAP
jgi:hypothetical protein